MIWVTRRGRSERGLSVVETLVGIAVFFLIGVSVYQAYATLLRVFVSARIQFLAASIAEEEMELIRNIPYEQVGVEGGVPSGVISSTTVRVREQYSFSVKPIIRNVDDPFDGVACLGGGELCGGQTDLSPADYKLVEILVTCVNCGSAQTFRTTGRVAPKALEAASTNGSLFVQVIDANGQSVPGADVQVVNTAVSPPVNFLDSTGSDGFLRIIDVPPSAQSYQITVSKAGYSSDQTYAASAENPNPVKPHATVAAQTVTQVSFAIDRTSQMSVASVTETCAPVPSYLSASVVGSKLIGRDPNVLKHAAIPFVAPEGTSVLVAGLEWDVYTISLEPQQGGYDLAGTIPLSPFFLAPNAGQNVKLVMKPSDPQSVLVTVRDAATNLPLTDASVTIAGAAYEQTLVTGRGFLKQTGWSGGPGQANFTNQAMYAEDDGNVDVTAAPGEVRLKQAFTGEAYDPRPFFFSAAHAAPEGYVPAGTLTSSTFDTGSPSNFYDLAFQPTGQNPYTGFNSVQFQFAATNTPNPVSWDFKGPDGTAGTYYAYGSPNIHASHNGNRYFRYKLYLSTASTTFTPSVSDVSVVFASECVPPGQVLFSGVPEGTHNLAVSLAGYAAFEDVITVIDPWQSIDVSLVPSSGGGGGGLD